MFRCPFFMQLGGEKMILPFASVYPKLSCRGSRLDRWGFLFLLGDLQVFLSHIKSVCSQPGVPRKHQGKCWTGSYTTIPPNVQAPSPVLKAEHHHTEETSYITASCIFLLYFMPRGERWNTQSKPKALPSHSTQRLHHAPPLHWL